MMLKDRRVNPPPSDRPDWKAARPAQQPGLAHVAAAVATCPQSNLVGAEGQRQPAMKRQLRLLLVGERNTRRFGGPAPP